MRPRSSSDPSEQKAKAPLAPTLASAKNPLHAEITNWGKRSSSGYVGLSNQGATCYLNSLLQCLYMTPEFRHSLFKWKYKPPPNTTFNFDFHSDHEAEPNDADIDGIYDAPPEHSIPYQVQCLFARLHTSHRGACSTKPLTKSFHWDDGQAFQQHDVQELLRVLFDAVSRALSRVGKGDLLNDLCKGVLLDYLDCQACHNGRAREDIFLDLSLTIDNINSLQDAISKFITPEIMCEGNQVNCYQCNKKQDFKKGLKFKKLPSLLIIQLKRFQFNWELNRRTKVSHKVTFPKELDMKTYIDQQILHDHIQNVDDLKYSLYGVIIQSGGALGGHYYAYIKPYDDKKWYCFNDSAVRELDEKSAEFENAFGGEKVRGTGYVLLYRQTNLKLPADYGHFPQYLTRMIEKEDEIIKIQWQQWQKEMRTITINVSYPNANTATVPMQNNADSDEKKDEKTEVKYSENGTEICIKIDVEEYTFESLLRFVRKCFGINDAEIPLQNSRLRKYYVEYDFIAEGYDDENVQQSKVEIAKWPKHGLYLKLEIKDEIATKFEYFDPNSILISLFVVTEENTASLVDRGFIQSATFTKKDLPPGGICSVVVDAKAPLAKIKPVLYEKLCEHDIVPEEWLNNLEDRSKFDAQQLNLIKFEYNRIRLFFEEGKNLQDYNIKLGAMLFIELQSKQSLLKTAHHSDDNEQKTDANASKLAKIPTLNPSYQRSKLAVLYEEQRLKITVQFNEPLPAKSAMDRVEELLMTPKMIGAKRQSVDHVFKKRLEFSHAVRLSKEASLLQFKIQIGNELGLGLNEFRLRKSSNQPELRDTKQTLHSAGVHDGGLVYVEYGVPTGPKEMCITFSLYDVNKLLTDPHKKKKQLAQKLFEYPFRRDIKVSVLKKEIVDIINKIFPLYRQKYNFIEAIKVLKKEEKERNEFEIEQMKKATEISQNAQIAESAKEIISNVTQKTDPMASKNNPFINQSKEEKSTNPISNGNALVVMESKTETQSESDVEANDENKKDINPKRKNIFGIEFVRLRKQRGAKVMEMLLDDRKLSKQIMGKKDSINLVIEKIPIAEHFTQNHICFWLQKYRCDVGKAWNGKIFKKKEFVIDKNSKISDLKNLISNLLRKSNKKYAQLSESEIVKNVSITKGFSTSPMRLNNINRLQWVHRVALHQVGVDPDAYFYQLKNMQCKTGGTANSENMPGNSVKSAKITGSGNNPATLENGTDGKTNDDESVRSYNGKVYKEEELLTVMQNALVTENDDIIGRPNGFHLRNGDLIVWTDITWRPNPTQIKEKQELDEEEKRKKGNLKKNPNFRGTGGSIGRSRFKPEAAQLTIRTYEEYLEDEKKKKEEEEKQRLVKEKEKKEKGENNDVDKTSISNDKDLRENEQLFNAMVAEDVNANDIENPMPKNRKRGGSF